MGLALHATLRPAVQRAAAFRAGRRRACGWGRGRPAGGAATAAAARRPGGPHRRRSLALALALTIAAVAATAPALPLDSASAQADESIRPFNPNGTQVPFLDSNGSSTGTPYFFPRGMAIGDDGRLFLVDECHRVMLFDDEYNFVSSIGKKNNTNTEKLSCNRGDGESKTIPGTGDGEFVNPKGVAVNSSGHIFVADTRTRYEENNIHSSRIQILLKDGTFAGELDKSGVPTVNLFNNDHPSFIDPIEIAVSPDNNRIYVTTEGGSGHAIWYFYSNGTYEGILGNRVDVGDTVTINVRTDNRTRVFELYPNAISASPRGVGDSIDHFRVTIPGTYTKPAGIDIGAGGLLAVAEAADSRIIGHIVSILDPENDHRKVFTIGDPNTTGNDARASREGLFNTPRYVSFNDDGNLLAVVDPFNFRIQVFQLDTIDGRATGVSHPDGKPAFVISTPSGFTPFAAEFNTNNNLVYTRAGPTASIVEVHELVLPAVKNITAVSRPGDGGSAIGRNILVAGGTIDVVVEFNTGLIRVDGTPHLAIGPNINAEYVPYTGETTSTLRFTYTVREGDAAADFEYDPATALSLNGATITAGPRNVSALTALPQGDSSSLLANHGITVDAAQPELVSIYSPDAQPVPYGVGSTIRLVLNYSEPVVVSVTDPKIELDVVGSGGPVYANYDSGNNTAELTFVYMVQEGDSASDVHYISENALIGISIQDVVGHTARQLPHPRDITGSGVMIDTMHPRAISAGPTSADGMYGIGNAIEFSVAFDEAVHATGRITLDLATTPARSATYVQGTDGDTDLLFRYVVQEGDSAPGGLRYAGVDALEKVGETTTIQDAAGNDALTVLPADQAGFGVMVDGKRPAVLSVSPASDGGTYGIDEAVEIAVVFDETVTVTGTPFLELATAPARRAAYVAGTDGDTELLFRYVVQQGDSAPGGLRYAGVDALKPDGVSIKDAAGNNANRTLPAPGPLAGIAIDGSGGNGNGNGGTDPGAPAVVSVQVRGGGGGAPGPYAAGQAIAIDVEFSAPVDVHTPDGAAPYLELRTGSAGARAGYESGSGSSTLGFAYTVRGGDIAARLSYAGTGALALGGGAITAAGTGTAASVVLPAPGAPGSLSHAASPAVRIDPDPGRPLLDIGILAEAGAAGGGVSAAAALAAERFNERQGSTPAALIVNATAYDAGATAAAAAEALRAAHSSGAGPSVYVGPSTDRGLHAAMPYADANGIVLVSAGSTAPSLAVGGDRTFRLLPSDRLEAEALARHAGAAGAEFMHAVLEDATYGAPSASGSLEDESLPPPQGAFAHGFDEALSYSAVPSLSGTIPMGGAAGSYEAAAAAVALDAAVRSGGTPAAVVYLGSPDGLAALADSSAGYAALSSAAWFASSLSAGSSLLAGGGTAAGFAAQAGLSAAQWSVPAGDLTREIDSLLPPGADATARHRAYAAYDAVTILGTAAAAASGSRGDPPGAAAVADGLPGTAAAYTGALGDIALDYAGDLWVPARYDLWSLAQPGGAGAAAEWSQRDGALDGERACSIMLARAKIDYGPIDSGQTSRPHLQTIVNTGQLPFSRVDLTATPWHVDSPGACAPGSQPSLPVGLSEIRTELGGQFSDLAASGTVLAQGLKAGGQAPLWYRLSLANYADLPQAQITQCATYVVRCS